MDHLEYSHISKYPFPHVKPTKMAGNTESDFHLIFVFLGGLGEDGLGQWVMACPSRSPGVLLTNCKENSGG